MIDSILKAKTWRDIGVPRNEFVNLRTSIHPDRNKDPKASDAFAILTNLYEGPDFDLRMVSGRKLPGHKIQWTTKRDFADREAVAFEASQRLQKAKYPQFFTRMSKDLITDYEEGWWLLGDLGKIDSRTAVWVAKRLAGAITQAGTVKVIHGDINPNTVVVMPSEHGLRLDGYWSAVQTGSRLVLKPEYAPARYLKGAGADEDLMVAQAAHMLTNISNADTLLMKVFEEHSNAIGDGRQFFEDVLKASEKLYGKAKWHPLENPQVEMI